MACSSKYSYASARTFITSVIFAIRATHSQVTKRILARESSMRLSNGITSFKYQYSVFDNIAATIKLTTSSRICQFALVNDSMKKLKSAFGLGSFFISQKKILNADCRMAILLSPSLFRRFGKTVFRLICMFEIILQISSRALMVILKLLSSSKPFRNRTKSQLYGIKKSKLVSLLTRFSSS